MLDHVSDKNDSAKWLSYYLGRRYVGSFTLALEALGIPVVKHMDEKSTAAMWADANIIYTQQKITKRHISGVKKTIAKYYLRLSDRLSQGYEKMLSQHVIVFLKPPESWSKSKVHPVMISKAATDIKLQTSPMDPEKCYLFIV